ncbi:Flagellar protein FliS [Candidatus Sulfopaludibacter sp. SbA3]|nr:Flagellar protein FliS [Candidatus Sulfopaludibacter sp. SbA3]
MAKDVYLETRVLTADPVELIHILYEHALVQIRSARTALQAGDIAGRTKAIGKALEVVGELEGSLDHNAGGSISQNLARLYQYMRRRLVEGNVKKQGGALAEVESLMQTLDEGWSAMRHTESPRAISSYAASAADSDGHSWSA